MSDERTQEASDLRQIEDCASWTLPDGADFARLFAMLAREILRLRKRCAELERNVGARDEYEREQMERER